MMIYGITELLGRSVMIFVREYWWAARLQTKTVAQMRKARRR